MGRDFHAATELMHQALGSLKAFTEILLPQDRLTFIEFAEYALCGRTSSMNADSPLSSEAALIVILLEEQKRTQHLYNELCAEIERLKMVAVRLQEAISLEEIGP